MTDQTDQMLIGFSDFAYDVDKMIENMPSCVLSHLANDYIASVGVQLTLNIHRYDEGFILAWS